MNEKIRNKGAFQIKYFLKNWGQFLAPTMPLHSRRLIYLTHDRYTIHIHTTTHQLKGKTEFEFNLDKFWKRLKMTEENTDDKHSFIEITVSDTILDAEDSNLPVSYQLIKRI